MSMMPDSRPAPIKADFRSAMIVEDHPLFCDALAMTLQSVAGIETVHHAETIAAALERLAAGGPRPDVIVLDLNLPDVSGLDGLMRLRQAAPDLPIVVVSSIDEARVIRSTIMAGAAGFVPKHSKRELFRVAFNAIARGEVFMPEASADTTVTDGNGLSQQDEAIRRLSQLTRQQARILEQICEGKMNKQIAYDLSIAETTVKAHVTAIMRKLGVYSRTQAVLLAREAQSTTPLPESWRSE